MVNVEERLSKELGISLKQVQNVINLLDSKTTGIVWTFLRNKALEKLCITIQYF